MGPTRVYLVESRAQSSCSSKAQEVKPTTQAEPWQGERRGLVEIGGMLAQGVLILIFFPLLPPVAHMGILPVSKQTAVALSTINAGTEAPLQIILTLWLVMRGLVRPWGEEVSVLTWEEDRLENLTEGDMISCFQSGLAIPSLCQPFPLPVLPLPS